MPIHLSYSIINTGGNDGYGNDNGSTFSNSSTTMNIGNDGGNVLNFFRFPVVVIPNNSKIVSAYLTLVNTSKAENQNIYTEVYANDADNAVAPTTYSGLTGKTKTTAYTTWTFKATGVAGALLKSPNIASVIQEVVERAGWASGNALMLLVQGLATGLNDYTAVACYEHTRWDPALLEIDYQGPTGGMVNFNDFGVF